MAAFMGQAERIAATEMRCLEQFCNRITHAKESLSFRAEAMRQRREGKGIQKRLGPPSLARADWLALAGDDKLLNQTDDSNSKALIP